MQELHLNNNNVSFVYESILHNYSNMSRKLQIFNNPWNCDCHTKDLISKIVSDNHNQTEIAKFTCFNSKKPFIEIEKDLICPIIHDQFTTNISIIIAFCSVLFGSIIALFFKYNLEIKIFLYSRNWCLWWVAEDDADEDKKYDIFLSFSHEDVELVMSEILPKLEEGEQPFKVCIHYRDWEIGEWIHNNIFRSVQESRMTVIILSSSFAKSHWGMMEFRTAQRQMLEDKRARVVIVLIEDIESIGKLVPDLKLHLDLSTYVMWNDPYFWKKFMYALPHSSLKP